MSFAELAERLPDGLVKEMETFIKPGAIMPNFDVRKELQIRYQVDRRHLYDYFHSRGVCSSFGIDTYDD